MYGTAVSAVVLIVAVNAVAAAETVVVAVTAVDNDVAVGTFDHDDVWLVSDADKTVCPMSSWTDPIQRHPVGSFQMQSS